MSSTQVCILGDSWITRLEAYCKSAGIAEDLGCRDLKLTWMGKGGRRWSSAMADLERLSKSHHPDVIVLHCGGNDLGAIRTVSLMLQMREGLDNLLKPFANSRFLFSEICQHQKWQFGAIPGSKLEKSRRRLNKEVATLLHLHDMEVISHANISFRDEKLFLRDGVHLTPEGNAVFLRNIQQHFAADPKKQNKEDCKGAVVSRELSCGRFKGPIQYTAWKEMKSVLNPDLFYPTLDPLTAHPNLELSGDMKLVRHSDVRRQFPDTPKRFSHFIIVMGCEGFASGRHYWEVNVTNKSEWYVGIANEFVNRHGNKNASPEDGYWAIYLRNGIELKALDATPRPIYLRNRPSIIGVYLDYEGGQVSFYNAKDMSHIYTFSSVFTEKLFPYFSPGYNDGGRNARELQLAQHPTF